MTSFERIGGAAPVSTVAATTSSNGAAGTARGTMAAIGERVLAWTAASFPAAKGAGAAWSAQTGVAGSGFAPSPAELARGGDVYGLRQLTGEIASHYAATPAQEGALGRAIEDFTRAAALHFNGRAGGDDMVSGVARALDHAIGAGGDGIDGVTTRIETAARSVEQLNQ